MVTQSIQNDIGKWVQWMDEEVAAVLYRFAKTYAERSQRPNYRRWFYFSFALSHSNERNTVCSDKKQNDNLNENFFYNTRNKWNHFNWKSDCVRIQTASHHFRIICGQIENRCAQREYWERIHRTNQIIKLHNKYWNLLPCNFTCAALSLISASLLPTFSFVDGISIDSHFARPLLCTRRKFFIDVVAIRSHRHWTKYFQPECLACGAHTHTHRPSHDVKRDSNKFDYLIAHFPIVNFSFLFYLSQIKLFAQQRRPN